ncbi:acyl-CoA dehydrogenase [Flavobacterium sp. NRK1]|uniref:acyl-CoA dehydrogenase family protein n=1 Tax=Flavobacterium sp. NRK1 TaxID=2954929 RepID=UPI0020924D15|nr:acyl-CoA dehydrogenase [Flavobacterium sp. NRK1]MCO6149317.1 acyl-CoA dehydrogenase family protein [Flavobacterium sp. NRK1]
MDITFNNNPKLSILIPIFYLAWQDDFLNKREFDSINNFINNQDWFTKAEKEFLKTKIDYTSPPSRSELFHWQEKIDNVFKKHPKPANLTELGILIANEERLALTDEDIKRLAGPFAEMESELGIMSKEILSGFNPNRNTITHKYKTQQSFDVDLMTHLLDGDQAKVINEIKALISTPEFKMDIPADMMEYREKVYEWSKLLAQHGLGAYAYPKEHGGKGDIEGYFSIMETLSYHDLSLVIKFGVQFGLWGMSILSLGTEKHYKKYLKDIASLKLPGGFAMTETHHGSNVKGVKTTAVYNHDERTFIINTPEKYDRKEYIGNTANHGEMVTVFAKLIINNKDYGVNAFIVPIRDSNKNILEGVTIGDCGPKMGLNGVDNGIITFKNVVIPYENMLDRFAQVNENGEFESPIPSDNRRFFTMLGTLVGGRIGIPRSALAAAKTGLTIAIKYGDKRRQFGPEDGMEVPILNYRMHQLRLMPYLANAYAIHFGLQYLTKRFVNRTEDQMQEIEALAAGMKSYSTWNTRDTLQECREACGGKGYLSENRIDDLKNDTEIYTTFEGDNTVLMQLTAKNRLGEFRKQFGEMNVSSIFNYVLNQAKTSITEKNPFATRNTDEQHLKDKNFHLHAFQYREKEIVSSAARRFKKLVDDGLDTFDAANVMHPHMIQISDSYLDRVFLEQFQAKLATVNDTGVKEVLDKLYNLFALNKIAEHKAWYLEQGYMEGVKTKAIRKLVSQLCWEIRQDAVPLTDAFNIPESCLAAIITNKSGEA